MRRAAPRKSVLVLANAYAPNVGGVETHLADLTRALVARGWAVSVLTFFPLTTRVPWKRRETRDGARIRRLWWFGVNWFHTLEHIPALQFLYLVPRLFTGLFFWLLLHGREARVIHAHGLAPAFCARALGPLFGKRLVFSSHSIYGLGRRPAVAAAARRTLARFDALLALSEESAAELAGAGLDPARVRVFRYWIDLGVFAPGDRGAARRALGLDGGAFVCLFVGRLIELKGVRLLLEAARRPELRGVTFVLAGVGPLEGEVRRAAEEAPNIRFAGGVRNEDLAPLYRAADLLCVPSLYAEGFGRVILESLACGTPVLGTDCPGIREAAGPEVAWYLRPQAGELPGALARLAAARDGVAARRGACRAFAAGRYSGANADLIERALLGAGEGGGAG